MAEQPRSEWGKKRPGNWWDEHAAIWCGSTEPHPRHDWRGFAGGHNTDILTCLGHADSAVSP